MTTAPLHRLVAGRWRRERRGRRAGVGAVVGAAAGAILGVDPWMHLGVLAACAAVAAAWPVRFDERRALRWVGERAGLAYETAWEHSATPNADAAPGPAAALRAAVAVEGRLSVRDVAPPAVAAWWLPLCVLALGVWTWATLSFGPGGHLGTPFATPPSPTAATAPAAPVGDPEAIEDPGEAEGLDPALPDTPHDPSRAPGTAAPAGQDGGVGAGDGTASERDVLERFLDRVRERAPDEVPARVAPAELEGDPSEDGERGDAASESGTTEGQDRPEGSEGDGRRDADEGQSDGEGDAEPGDTDAGEGTAPARDAPNGVEDATDAGPEAGEGGVGATGLEEGGDESAAGLGIGAAGDSGTGSDPAAGDPEPLPSILGPGPESPVGGVDLPGVAPLEPFPAGAQGSAFRRAVEEALGEGDLPAPYQEIIRNYFR